MGLSSNNDDVEELVEEHSEKLTTEELQELKKTGTRIKYKNTFFRLEGDRGRPYLISKRALCQNGWMSKIFHTQRCTPLT
ncbi:hypothetical protein TNCT_295361 [Trichonephila clavata]|uniref:Uncharacterized protein n=1 Tax=Trichonephila clavata TaxID=2740835 RepID=A0A8X6KFR3_TRICU|nr:hypothetical protein TNCT_295361 [Trichonephila clavata]